MYYVLIAIVLGALVYAGWRISQSVPTRPQTRVTGPRRRPRIPLAHRQGQPVGALKSCGRRPHNSLALERLLLALSTGKSLCHDRGQLDERAPRLRP